MLCVMGENRRSKSSVRRVQLPIETTPDVVDLVRACLLRHSDHKLVGRRIAQSAFCGAILAHALTHYSREEIAAILDEWIPRLDQWSRSGDAPEPPAKVPIVEHDLAPEASRKRGRKSS